MDFLHFGTVILAVFLASLVEFVEALTIVLAVGVSRNWKSAFAGTMVALLALALIIVIFGHSIQKVPITWMQLGVGAIVAIFGFKWLKKATLRSAGLIPMHDEEKEFSETIHALGTAKKNTKLEWIAFLTAFKGVFLEGFEVAFIVITAGSVSGHFKPAFLGASLALLCVLIVGIIIHKPLSRVPENTLKKSVGIMLSAFGIFWVGEGLGMEWPMGDGFLIVLAMLFGLSSWMISESLRRKRIAKA